MGNYEFTLASRPKKEKVSSWKEEMMRYFVVKFEWRIFNYQQTECVLPTALVEELTVSVYC